MRVPSPRRAALVVVLAGAATVIWVERHRTPPLVASPFPAPHALREPAVSPADFAGAEACAECHQAEYAQWRASTHGHAGGAPGPAVVIAPFGGPALRFKDATVTPVVDSGRYRFVVAQQDRPARTFAVDAVVGAGRMAGGGTQSFFTREADGTVRFLPFDWSKSSNTWFCNTNGRTNRGWVPVTPSLSLAECADWPPYRTLGSEDRFDNCQQCHGSQIRIAFDSAAHRWDTGFSTLAVDCESCHGPAARHVARARAGKLGADIGLTSLATLDKTASLAVCYQCHSLKDQIEPGYLPGRSLAAHFALRYPILTNRPLFPDGRVRVFAYQENQLYSDCFVNGAMTCTSCHDPHSQTYRAVDGTPLAGRFDDRQCTDCHVSKARNVSAHTHHAAGSPGSRCVACHMPYLQQPNTGVEIRYARSDHVVSIPRPQFDADLGIKSACAQCHANRTTAALQAAARNWWPVLKPHAPAIRDFFPAETTSDRAAAGALLLRPESPSAIAKFAGMSNFFLRFAGPDLPFLEQDVVARLERLAADSDLDVQSLALATLQLAGSQDDGAQRFLKTAVRALAERDRPVRDRWVWALDFRGDAYLARGETSNALATYRLAVAVEPKNTTALRDVALAYANERDWLNAAVFLRASLAADPRQPLVLDNLGFVLDQLGDRDGALAAWGKAAAIDPNESATWYSLGNAYMRRSRVVDARDAYRKATALAPGDAAAQFGLARAWYQLGERDSAASALRAGLEFEPANASARAMLDSLRARASRR